MLLTVILVSAQEPMNPWETLPGDQSAARSDRDDRCREPSVVPDGLSMIALSADDVWNLAVSALD
jgi:hypothetical protein